MKKLALTALMAFAFAGLLTSGLLVWYRAMHPAPPETTRLPETIVLIGFHGNAADPTYQRIEGYAKDVLEESFAEAVRAGKLAWASLNFEEPKNAVLRRELEIDAPCLVLADVRPHHPNIAINLQQQTQRLADRPEELKAYLRGEIKKALQ